MIEQRRMPWSRPLIAAAVLCCLGACDRTQDGAPTPQRNDLAKMRTGTIWIKGRRFHVWLATSLQERQLGLMHVTADELRPAGDGADRGMLFVFEREQPLKFWMKNTIVPLDIAYIRSDGTIVKTWTMQPSGTRTYPSGKPARFALEINAGRLAELGIRQHDRAEIPPQLLKTSP